MYRIELAQYLNGLSFHDLPNFAYKSNTLHSEHKKTTLHSKKQHTYSLGNWHHIIQYGLFSNNFTFCCSQRVICQLFTKFGH